ncbi:sugar phosphate nucleotidyltransferase, partial [Staphylococcus aureus]|nr:sugar phosphate nucleotidyltransferase [Staphylococcus aureus]
MEKTKDAIVIPMDAGWSDVGSWSSLWEINDKDSDGNVIVGDIFSHETKNSFIYAESGIVATVGVENLVVV